LFEVKKFLIFAVNKFNKIGSELKKNNGKYENKPSSLNGLNLMFSSAKRAFY
jgi:hypothetical protein